MQNNTTPVFFFVILPCVMSIQWKVGGTLLPAGHKYSIVEHCSSD